VSIFHWSSAPDDATPQQRKNFINVQIDAIGVGVASAASPFLPIFLTRLGASNTQVGLLTAMPAFTGMLLAIFIGRFLQTRRNLVPWFSRARAIVISAYALTGIVPFLVPNEIAVPAVLIIWALATIPQTVVNVCFSLVMNAVAGPKGRYELMSRRWSILGLTTAVAVAAVGQVLDRISFPFNYQLVFMVLSIGGLISLYYSGSLVIPDNERAPQPTGQGVSERFKNYFNTIRGERPFVSFLTKRFVYMSGSALSVPLFPLYFVREVHASDWWIGVITTGQTAIMLLGYYVWTKQTKRRGSRFVLLATAFGLALYPALTALTLQVEWIAFYAVLAGIFQAGLDLVFFDELMKTLPPKQSATFVSVAQSLEYLPRMVAPLIGTTLATYIGLSGALIVSAGLRLLGCALFVWSRSQPAPVTRTTQTQTQ
jgi:MFS family permease